MSFGVWIETHRIGWWIERFWHHRCFRHDWRQVVYWEDTGYSLVEVDRARECDRCGAWRRPRRSSRRSLREALSALHKEQA